MTGAEIVCRKAQATRIVLLKRANLMRSREVVSSAVERRYAKVRKLWTGTREGIGRTCPRARPE